MSPASPGTPGPVARRLFFTDFEGRQAEPEDVFVDGRLDGGWQQREPEAIALLGQPGGTSVRPVPGLRGAGRLGLAGRLPGGDGRGRGSAVGRVARPVRGPQVRRGRHVRAAGRGCRPQRGTAAERRAAQAALLGLADRYFFDRRLVQGMYDADVRALATEVDTAIEAGIARLRRHEPVGFDLATQVAGLIAALATVDPDRARARAAALLATDPPDRAVWELGDLASVGD